MRVHTRLIGTSPLLQHNIQLADPDNLWAKRISAVTSKRKKSEEDRQEIAALEFQGSLYVEDNRVIVPVTNVRKCFQEAAKLNKRGRDITRAVNALALSTPLIYPGPQTVEGLLADPTFRDTTLVGVGNKRVVRTRPIFREWSLVAEWEVITSVLDLDDFQAIAEMAGLIEGLGDNRVGGYGRFEVEVTT